MCHRSFQIFNLFLKNLWWLKHGVFFNSKCFFIARYIFWGKKTKNRNSQVVKLDVANHFTRHFEDQTIIFQRRFFSAKKKSSFPKRIFFFLSQFCYYKISVTGFGTPILLARADWRMICRRSSKLSQT